MGVSESPEYSPEQVELFKEKAYALTPVGEKDKKDTSWIRKQWPISRKESINIGKAKQPSRKESINIGKAKQPK
jgi:hypothetical protein